MTRLDNPRRAVRTAVPSQPRTSGLIQEIQQSLELLISGQVTLDLLRSISGSSLALSKSEMDTIAIDFPFAVVLGIAFRSPPAIQTAALRVFCFFAMSDSFCASDFLCPEVLSFLLDRFMNGGKPIFSCLLRFFAKFCRISIWLRDFLLASNVLEHIYRNPVSIRIPSFLTSLIDLEPLPPSEIFEEINAIFALLIESHSAEMQCNVLQSLNHLLERELPFDYGFLVANIERLSKFDDDCVLIPLIQVAEKIEGLSIAYARIFFTKLGTLSQWSLLPPLLHLFIVKSSEWSGFVDDELIETILLLSDQADYREERMMVEIILILFDFVQVFDIRVIAEICKFVTDPEIGRPCIEALFRALARELEPDQIAEIQEIMSEAILEIAEIVEKRDDDPGLVDIGEKFLEFWSKAGTAE
jgi:hypothetical protein